MTKKQKYDKYFTEANPIESLHLGKVDAKTDECCHYDYRDNEECPHFIEGHVRDIPAGTAVSRPGKYMLGKKRLQFPIDPRIYYYYGYRAMPKPTFPMSNVYTWSMSYMSTDPNHPDDIGGTFCGWVGEGEAAELHKIDRPTTCIHPLDIPGGPGYTEELHGPGLFFIVADSPLAASIPARRNLPPGFKNCEDENWVPPEVTPMPKGSGKYGKDYSEIDVKKLPVYSSFRDKISRVMFYDASYNANAPHSIDCHLIYAAGAGFGLGQEKILPLLPDGQSDEHSSYEPFLPHKHPFYQTFSFIGTDLDKFPDLGGTVEFWIGEGEQAEKHLISKATTVLVPKHTVHLPMYVREVHRPFVVATVLDAPIWAGLFTNKFPVGFKLG
jgi:hypothetical protein